jgi:hypothetical protein
MAALQLDHASRKRSTFPNSGWMMTALLAAWHAARESVVYFGGLVGEEIESRGNQYIAL